MCLPKSFKPFDEYYSSDGEEIMIVEDQNDENNQEPSDIESSSDSSNGI